MATAIKAPTPATHRRRTIIIERALDQIGEAGDFKVVENNEYGPELRAAAKARFYQVLSVDGVSHNGSESLMLCVLQSMVRNFLVGYRACLIAHKSPPLIK